jgi:hypothetical protein
MMMLKEVWCRLDLLPLTWLCHLLQDDTFFALVEYKYKSKILNDSRIR